jgi:putative RNA 2'-phosphotransferase
MKERHVSISKFLSLVLRHQPEKVGITLDREGWVTVAELLEALEAHGRHMTPDELHEVVRANDKQRFAFSLDGLSIRASQGHSVQVELGYEPSEPPPALYHGTAERSLPSIRQQGLVRGRRHHVHLSEQETTAVAVGRRYGRPVILEIASGAMHADGHAFFRSANGVWLTEHVPARYITFGDGEPR